MWILKFCDKNLNSNFFSNKNMKNMALDRFASKLVYYSQFYLHRDLSGLN